ncbi:MAG: hypothetical protein Q8910_00425 [Bacteroidota bacterium]|nr:hypothetical protein [Bacteroidota bacterium]
MEEEKGEMKRMSGKVEKITSWKQLVEKPKVGKVQLQFPDGSIVELEVKGLQKSILESINEKWDAKKKPQPTNWVKVQGQAQPKHVTLTEGEEYDQWKNDCQAIENLKAAHIALEFLVIKPEPSEGLTGDDAIVDQIKQLNEGLLIGHFAEIIKAGNAASGFGSEDKVDDAKNF